MNHQMCFHLITFIVLILLLNQGKGEKNKTNRPLPLYDLQCVAYDWLNIQCSWKPTEEEQKAHTHIATNQTLYARLLLEEDFVSGNQSALNVCTNASKFNKCSPNYISCIQNSCRTFCDFEDFFRTQNYFYLAISQTYHSSEGGPFCELGGNTKLQRNISVKPGKARDVTVQKLGSRSFQLTWKASRASFWGDDELWFNISFASEYGDLYSFQSNSTSLTWSSDAEMPQRIKPHTTYTVTISYIPYINNTTRGYWSENVIYTFQTLSDVPKSAPTISPGGFELPESANQLNIFFRPLLPVDRHGVLKHITVTITAVSSSTIPQSNFSFPALDKNNEAITGLRLEDYDFNPSEDYKVIIDISNEKGFSAKPSSIYIKNQKSRLAAPDEFAVRFTSQNLTSQNLTSHVVLAYWTSVKNASHYRVYWCRGNSQYQCMETNMAMDWRQYKSDRDHSIVEVPIVVAWNEINDYTFGISAEGAETGYGILSSGLTFPKCSYNSNTSILPPKHFKYDDDMNQKAYSLRLTWDDYKCDESDYIEKYVITYRMDWLPEKWLELVVPVSHHSAVLLDLEGSESYIVQVYSKSPWNESATIQLNAKAVGRSAALNTGGKVGVGIASAVVIMFLIIGLYAVVRKLQKFYKVKKKGPEIILPDVAVTYDIKGEDDDAAMLTSNGIDNSYSFVTVQNGDNSSKQIAAVDEKMHLLNENGHTVQPEHSGSNGNLQNNSCTRDNDIGKSLNPSDYVKEGELFAAGHGKASVLPPDGASQYIPHHSQLHGGGDSTENDGEKPVVTEPKSNQIANKHGKENSQYIPLSSFEKNNNDDEPFALSDDELASNDDNQFEEPDLLLPENTGYIPQEQLWRIN